MYTQKRCVEHTFKECTNVFRYKKPTKSKIANRRSQWIDPVLVFVREQITEPVSLQTWHSL